MKDAILRILTIAAAMPTIAFPAALPPGQLGVSTVQMMNGRPADCESVRSRASQMLQELDVKVSPADRQQAEAVAADTAKKGNRVADGYSLFAAAALMRAQYKIALWGELKAAILEWSPRHVSNVAAYLVYLDRLDEAQSFLRCASTMNPQSPFIIETNAMLSYRRKDFANAEKLITQAVVLLPKDMNVRYSAGIISYRAGDRAKAREYLHDAQNRAPHDPTVAQALKVVDPTAATAKTATPDPMRKQIDECMRFMDELLVLGEKAAKVRNEIDRETGGKGNVAADALDSLRNRVTTEKKNIAALEQSTRQMIEQYKAKVGREFPNAPSAWNSVLQECITDYFHTLRDYENIFPARVHAGESIIIAAAMHQSALGVARKGKVESGNYVVQDEAKKFSDEADRLYRELHTCEEKCAQQFRGDQLLGCIKRCKEAYCFEAVPLWYAERDKIEANAQAAQAGWPRIAADYINYWLDYADRAKDYGKRTLAIMKVNRNDPQNPEVFARQTYQDDIQNEVFRGVLQNLTNARTELTDELASVPRILDRSGQLLDIADCRQKPPEAVGLVEALDQIVDAFKEATEYDASFHLPECELELGPFKVEVKPFAENEVNLELTGKGGESPWSVAASTDLDRWGVEVGYSESEMIQPLSEFGGSEFGLVGEVGATAWGEGKRGGQADYGVSLYTKGGVGLEKEGAGKVACYIWGGEAKVNVRVLAERLTH
jgi:Flp pilus assembly protein TadD